VKAGFITVPRALAAAAIAAGLGGAGLALAGASSPLRSPLVLLFLFITPLLAVAGLLRGLDLFARIFVSCAAMVVINVGVAETMLAAGLWSPRGGLVAIMAICAVLGLVQLPAGRRWADAAGAAISRLERRLERT
jgi:hypothetical protein